MPFRDLDAYINQARRAKSDRELFDCSEAAARQLGLPWLAIVQSMAFFRPDSRYFRLDNFQSWGDVFVAEGYYRDDPALLARVAHHQPGFRLARNEAAAGRLHAAAGAHCARSSASRPPQWLHRSDRCFRRTARMLLIRDARWRIAAFTYLQDRDAHGE